MLDALLFSARAYQLMMAYTHAVTTEIGGIGRIQEDQFGIQYVSDIIILPQEVTGTTTMSKVEDVQEFFKTIPDEEHAEWCFNWHSHVNMGVTPSGTDLSNYREFIDLFNTFIPMIVNKKREYSAWVYNARPTVGKYDIGNIWLYELLEDYAEFDFSFKKDEQVQILEWMIKRCNLRLSQEDLDFVQQEVEAKVTEKKYIPQAYGGQITPGGLVKVTTPLPGGGVSVTWEKLGTTVTDTKPIGQANTITDVNQVQQLLLEGMDRQGNIVPLFPAPENDSSYEQVDQEFINALYNGELDTGDCFDLDAELTPEEMSQVQQFTESVKMVWDPENEWYHIPGMTGTEYYPSEILELLRPKAEESTHVRSA